MSTLYLDRKDTALKRDGRALAVYCGGERHGTVPFNLIDRVVVRANVSVDTGLLATLAAQDIPVCIISGRGGRNLASVVGTGHADAARRIAQYQRYGDKAWRLVWSRRLVRHKLLAQARLLHRGLRRRPDQRYALTRALDRLGNVLAQVPAAGSVASLRGLEGAGAAGYFSGLTVLFPPSLDFTGRNRRPPRDPVNAALSLAYTLVHFEVVQACHAAGVDPLIGYYHELGYGRESLASDLLEPLRPKVDSWVWYLFRRERLRAELFSTANGACLLGKTGRQIFYQSYEMNIPPVRRLLRRVVHRIVAAIADPAGGPA